MRVVFDIIFILFYSFNLLETDIIEVPAFFILVLPILILESLLLVTSVKLSFKKRRRITYRMLKTRITTAEQNNEMWSSDDKDYTYETENSKVQDDEDASFDLD